MSRRPTRVRLWLTRARITASRMQPRMWSTAVSTRVSTFASRTQTRESRADTWPNGPSATSCGLLTTNDDDDGLDDVCDDHQHNDRAHTCVVAGLEPASTHCEERVIAR